MSLLYKIFLRNFQDGEELESKNGKNEIFFLKSILKILKEIEDRKELLKFCVVLEKVRTWRLLRKQLL